MFILKPCSQESHRTTTIYFFSIRDTPALHFEASQDLGTFPQQHCIYFKLHPQKRRRLPSIHPLTIPSRHSVLLFLTSLNEEVFPAFKKSTRAVSMCFAATSLFPNLHAASLSTYFIKETMPPNSDSLIQAMQRGQIILFPTNNKTSSTRSFILLDNSWC